MRPVRKKKRTLSLPDLLRKKEDPMTSSRWIREMMEAQKETLQANRANRPVSVIRGKINKENHERIPKGLPPLPKPPIPFVVSAKTKAVLRRETLHWKGLLQRSPDQWLKVITMIHPPSVRSHVAWLVWWDFFGDRPASDRWSHLDPILSEYFIHHPAEVRGTPPRPHAPIKVIEAWLLKIGYSPWQAKKRAEGNSFEPKTQP